MVRAAQAGKHIFTEKLLASTVDGVTAIVAATDAAGVKLVVSLPRLYVGYTAAIREVIDSGRLGQISYGRVRLSHDGAVPRDGSSGWLPRRFFDPETAIGGALTDLGCHPTYLIQLFLGSNPQTVTATYGSVTGHSVDDHAVVTVRYADQAIGVIEAGFVSKNPFSIEVFGTEGSVTYSDIDGLRASGPGFDGQESLGLPDDQPMAFSQWVTHIRDDTRADDNVARAVELTRLVVAANRAAASAQTLMYTTD